MVPTFVESVSMAVPVRTILLCETVWVLDAAYEYAKPLVESALEKILQTGMFRFEAKDVVFAAFEEYKNSKVDFADCLLGRVHASLESEPTATFDTALKKLSTFELL